MTDKRKTVLAYAGYALVMAILFALLLFPDQAVRGFLESSAGRIHPDMTIRIGNVGPGFPLGVRMKDVSVYLRDKHYGDVQSLRVSPALFSLMGKRRAVAFKGRVFEGRVKGVCGQERTTGAWTVDMAFSDVGLTALDFVKRLSTHQVSGSAAGHIDADFDGGQAEIRSEVVLSDVAVTLAEPLFSIDTVGFDRIEATVVANGEKIRIERCIGSGKQLDGELSGDLSVRQPYGQSLLRLKGFVKPHAVFVSMLGESLPVDVLLGKNAGDKGFPIELTGTLAEPGVSLR